MVADINRPFIVNAIDEAALTGALRNLLRDPAMRTKLAAANLVKARAEFSIQTMIGAYDRLFSDTSTSLRSVA
jgi:glycosyltransferase involved in cell wall biosynthesis